jgi:hypothetical protein
LYSKKPFEEGEYQYRRLISAADQLIFLGISMNIFLKSRSKLLSSMLLIIVSILLFATGTAYVIRGTYYMVTSATDFEKRWIEEHYVFRGKNPLDIFERHYAELHGNTLPQIGRDNSIDSELGLITFGSYPPWSYFTGAVFTWPPSRTLAKWYFGLINLMLLSSLLIWAYHLGSKDGTLMALFFTSSLLATSSICETFGVGQYGVVVLSALVASLCLDRKDRWGFAGLLLGVAMIKVTLAGPFIIPFLIKRRWKALLVMAVYIGIGSIILSFINKTNPIEMLQQMVRAAETYAFEGHNFMIYLLGELEVGTGGAIKMLACLVMGAAIILSYLCRSSSMLTQFAIAALASRFWTYHRNYDNLILIFLMMALGVVALRDNNRLALASFFVMGLSLWPPARLTEIEVYRIFQYAAWLGCLSVLVYIEFKNYPASLLNNRSDVSKIKQWRGEKWETTGL